MNPVDTTPFCLPKIHLDVNSHSTSQTMHYSLIGLVQNSRSFISSSVCILLFRSLCNSYEKFTLNIVERFNFRPFSSAVTSCSKWTLLAASRNILWRIDPLLSNDSVNIGRC
jgi:hypothetical protein